MFASSEGHIDIVRILLEHGADADAHNKFGLTVLTSASYKGHTEIVQILLEYGANVDACYDVDDDDADDDDVDKTALMAASLKSHFNIVQLLIKHGANPHIKNQFGETAFTIATDINIKNILTIYQNNEQ